jgi:hypothetical protein
MLVNTYYFGNTQNNLMSKTRICTGKSLSKALILGSTNQQYDKRLFIDLPVQYMKTTSSEHGENMLCANIALNVKTKKQFVCTTCSPHILSL